LFELGGKSACLLFEDTDLDVAVPFASYFSVAASGQACIVPSRLLVHESLYDEVVSRVTAIFETMTVGNPFDEDTVFGPVISPQAVERIEGIIARAVEEKAGRLIIGGERPGGRFANGNYVAPALFVDVRGDSALFLNEVFGPVLAISKFSTEAEALALANGTRFGLYAYVFTRDISRALRVADKLTSGSVAINGFTGLSPRAPFGGVGISGFGKEGGREGLDEFLRTKTVFIAD
jgi:aldehyde dehydrogenase (NAD+)